MDLLDLLNLPSTGKVKTSWRQFFIWVPLIVVGTTLYILFKS